MSYLDTNRMDAIETAVFQGQSPYPWTNPQGLLTADGFRRLSETLPDVAQFERVFGKARAHGQQSHDRYTLEYHKSLDLPSAWRDFMAEMESTRYQRFIRRLFGRGGFRLRYHWHSLRQRIRRSRHSTPMQFVPGREPDGHLQHCP